MHFGAPTTILALNFALHHGATNVLRRELILGGTSNSFRNSQGHIAFVPSILSPKCLSPRRKNCSSREYICIDDRISDWDEWGASLTRVQLTAETLPSKTSLRSSSKQIEFERREAVSKCLTTGLSVATSLSLPIITKKPVNAEPTLNLSDSSTSTSTNLTPASQSLLSSYKPTRYQTSPQLGRYTFPPSFLPPLYNRATYRYSLGRDAWALEQLVAFANVTATIRTNIVQLQNDGGLWVCGPLWPTQEYCSLLDELGEVSHVVLPVNALEHKAAFRQFLRRYPKSKVWIAPGQYGPFGSCGVITNDMSEEEILSVVTEAKKTMGHRVDGIFSVGSTRQSKQLEAPQSKTTPSWIDEFDIETLYVDLPQNAGPVSECAFLHKPTDTLFVTDAVICVPLVSHATDTASNKNLSPAFPIQPIFETYFDESTLADPTFWPRTVLQAVFLPLRTTATSGAGANEDAIIYPGYEALSNRLVRAPILRAFVDARAPQAVRDWVNRIVGSRSAATKEGAVIGGERTDRFDRIVTAHFASPITAGPDLFSGAFAHLPSDEADVDRKSNEMSLLPPIACQDWSTLGSLNEFIEANKLGAPIVNDYKFGCQN